MYKEAVRPVLTKMDSEAWHGRAVEALHLAEMTPLTLRLVEMLARMRGRFGDNRLRVEVGGIVLDNPVMAGAGWDKAGRAVRGLYALGFSGVEVGTVVAYPQPGNPKPRQFIIGPGVAINSLGFNSPGMEAVAKNLQRYRGMPIPVGVSVGKNREVKPKDAPQAHAEVVRKLYEQAAYFAINVSSPNTPGLRALQERKPLTDIVQAVNGAMEEMGGKKPLFVKIAPDLDNEAVNDVIEVVADNGLTGIIATNTTIRPDLKGRYGPDWSKRSGGLSGDDPEFRKMATDKIAHIYRETGGMMEIIGVGGVRDAATVLEKMGAGARAVQVVTAIGGEGPAVAAKINYGLAEWMDRAGVNSIGEIVGSNAAKEQI